MSVTRNLHRGNAAETAPRYRTVMLLQDPPVVSQPAAGVPVAPATAPAAHVTPKIQVTGMTFYYGPRRVLDNIALTCNRTR